MSIDSLHVYVELTKEATEPSQPTQSLQPLETKEIESCIHIVPKVPSASHPILALQSIGWLGLAIVLVVASLQLECRILPNMSFYWQLSSAPCFALALLEAYRAGMAYAMAQTMAQAVANNTVSPWISRIQDSLYISLWTLSLYGFCLALARAVDLILINVLVRDHACNKACQEAHSCSRILYYGSVILILVSWCLCCSWCKRSCRSPIDPA